MSVGFFWIAKTSPGSYLSARRPYLFVDPDVQLAACCVSECRDRFGEFAGSDVLRFQVMEMTLGKRQHKVALLRGDVFYRDHARIVANNDRARLRLTAAR